MTLEQYLQLAGHFAMMSLIAIGGGVAVLPEMHRFLVDSRGWLTSSEFAEAVTLAQIAPGPNILFVSTLGWGAGGLAGAAIALVAIMLPSSLLVFVARRWLEQHRTSRFALALRRGMAPIAVAATGAAGYLLAVANDPTPVTVMLILVTIGVMSSTRLNPVWLIAAAGLLGYLGVR